MKQNETGEVPARKAKVQKLTQKFISNILETVRVTSASLMNNIMKKFSINWDIHLKGIYVECLVVKCRIYIIIIVYIYLIYLKNILRYSIYNTAQMFYQT